MVQHFSKALTTIYAAHTQPYIFFFTNTRFSTLTISNPRACFLFLAHPWLYHRHQQHRRFLYGFSVTNQRLHLNQFNFNVSLFLFLRTIYFMNAIVARAQGQYTEHFVALDFFFSRSSFCSYYRFRSCFHCHSFNIYVPNYHASLRIEERKIYLCTKKAVCLNLGEIWCIRISLKGQSFIRSFTAS